MKIVIDIDGVICDEYHPDVNHRRPYMHRIDHINNLYADGHEVIIYTSRGMNSCNDDQTMSDEKYRDLTEKQLVRWGLKYHKLYFGKPNADVYVDNKNVLMQEFFNQR